MFRFRTHALPLLLLLGLTLALRYTLECGLERGVRETIRRIEADRDLRIRLQRINSIGIRGIRVQGLKVFPRRLEQVQDTLFTGEEVRISIRLLPLFLGRLDLESLELNRGRLKLFQREDYCNYHSLLRSSTSSSAVSSATLSDRTHRILALLFRSLPQHLHVRDLKIETLRNHVELHLICPLLEMQNHQFETALTVIQKGGNDPTLHRQEHWNVSGKWNKDLHHIQGRVWTNQARDSLHIPYLDARFQAKIGFRELGFDLSFSHFSPHKLAFHATTTAEGLGVHYWRLAPQRIEPELIRSELTGTITHDQLELDEQSYIQIKHLRLHPQLSLKKANKYAFRLSLNEPHLAVRDVQEALPKGLFNQLDSLRAQGSFGYRFLLDLDLNLPDSVQLEAGVFNDHIQLLSPGRLTKINGEFFYTAYLKGVPVRSFFVGESNPNYRRLSEISPILQQAVLHSEDGNFYVHKGFSEKALRKALAHDIKEGRFAKGGSTVSMQLVKNVFLDKNKNLFRKAEEAMIVWLIENKHLTSKARMFEVYLNLIEWGPRIYGAEEAAEFYFGKSCAYLEPDEAIFLASIIPAPRWYASAFHPDGTLKENRYGHFRIVGGILSRIGIIPPIDPVTYVPKVELKGPARFGLKPEETTDSTLLQERI